MHSKSDESFNARLTHKNADEVHYPHSTPMLKRKTECKLEVQMNRYARHPILQHREVFDYSADR